MPDSGAVVNAVKLAGEVMLPGASNLVDGNLKIGLGHTVLGIAAAALVGPIGLLLVKANSYSYSVSGKFLNNQVADLLPSRSPGTSQEA